MAAFLQIDFHKFRVRLRRNNEKMEYYNSFQILSRNSKLVLFNLHFTSRREHFWGDKNCYQNFILLVLSNNFREKKLLYSSYCRDLERKKTVKKTDHCMSRVILGKEIESVSSYIFHRLLGQNCMQVLSKRISKCPEKHLGRKWWKPQCFFGN